MAAKADNEYWLSESGSRRLEDQVAQGHRLPGDLPRTPLRKWTEEGLCDLTGIARNTLRAVRHGWKTGQTVRLSTIRLLFDGIWLTLQPTDTDPANGVVPIEERMEPIRNAFLEWLRDDCKNLNPRGVSQTLKTVTLPLEEVYVSLATEREREHALWRDAPEEAWTDLATVMEDVKADVERERMRRSARRETIVQKTGLPQAVRERGGGDALTAGLLDARDRGDGPDHRTRGAHEAM